MYACVYGAFQLPLFPSEFYNCVLKLPLYEFVSCINKTVDLTYCISMSKAYISRLKMNAINSAVNHVSHYFNERVDTGSLFQFKQHLKQKLTKALYYKTNWTTAHTHDFTHDWFFIFKNGCNLHKFLCCPDCINEEVIHEYLPFHYLMSILPTEVWVSTDQINYFSLNEPFPWQPNHGTTPVYTSIVNYCCII